MFKSFSFIFCMAIIGFTAIGFALGASHLVPYGTLLQVSGSLLVATGIVLAFMALRARRSHDGEAFVQLGLAALVDLSAVIMVFMPLGDAQFPALMMVITMATGTASVLLIHAERLHWQEAYRKA